MAARKKQDFSTANMEPVYSSMAEAIAAPEAADAPGKSDKPAPQGVADVPEVENAPITQEAQQPKRIRRPSRPYTAQEVQELTEEGMTQGRKGLKLPRINLAFKVDVYNYVRTMSRVRGQSISDFLDSALRENMERNKDIYQEAQDFIKRMGG